MREAQSYAVEGAERAANTKCAPNELTAPEITGYDAETGKPVAEALGVEPCFVTPTWTEVTAGSWGDRWDLAYGLGRDRGGPDGSPLHVAALLLHTGELLRPHELGRDGSE